MNWYKLSQQVARDDYDVYPIIGHDEDNPREITLWYWNKGQLVTEITNSDSGYNHMDFAPIGATFAGRYDPLTQEVSVRPEGDLNIPELRQRMNRVPSLLLKALYNKFGNSIKIKLFL